MALISCLNQYYISNQIVFHVYQYKEKVYTSYREGISPLTNWLLLVWCGWCFAGSYHCMILMYAYVSLSGMCSVCVLDTTTCVVTFRIFRIMSNRKFVANINQKYKPNNKSTYSVEIIINPFNGHYCKIVRTLVIWWQRAWWNQNSIDGSMCIKSWIHKKWMNT